MTFHDGPSLAITGILQHVAAVIFPESASCYKTRLLVLRRCLAGHLA